MTYLKTYQQDCVDRLAAYFKRCRELGDARLAFLEDPARGDYIQPAGVPDMPYVCLKVPTGGGKTAIAAYCIHPMLEVIGQREAGPVLWLAPSTAIVTQTIEALQNRSHPYRRELDRAFDGRVAVCDLASSLYLRKPVIESQCVVIVTTIQALRVEDTDGRKVYEPNGELKHHFDAMTPEQRDALFAHADDGEDPTLPTLANVLRMHRPAVVVDEAHNARTDLSFETLRRFGPSCVLELTATPADDSNVLHAVSAARLKAAQMIKLPVMLRARKHARDAMASAVAKQKELAELAHAEAARKGYVRPIVLYQAQNSTRELNCDEVKRILVEELHIDADRIAIRTGDINSLPDNILSPDCPVEHVITVQALREGWDCPFAYILCSVANLGARTAVEQLLGRVLRMPYATVRGAEELNRAYCYATSANFQQSANNLESALVENCGFDKHEARRIVRREHDPLDHGLFGETPEPVTFKLAGSVDVDQLPIATKEHVSVATRADGGQTITWTGGPITDEHEHALAKAITDPRDHKAAARLRRRSWKQDDAPANVGVTFRVPTLAVREEGKWYVLEDQPLEADWSLVDANHELPESEFRIAPGDHRGAKIDVDKDGGVKVGFFTDLDRMVHLFERTDRDTPAKLANWLDRHIRETSLHAADKRAYLLRVVEDLIDRRGFELAQLDRHRHMLKDALAGKIAALRLNAETTAYQHLLNGDGFGVSSDCCISFPAAYPADSLCPANFGWQKHFYSTPAAMNPDELEVAKYLDSCPHVLHWVRNLDGPHHINHAFWLRKPHGRFFPDFVAELVGEKFLVVEFKGDRESKPEEQEKRRVGEMWEAASPNELGFVWALKDDWRAKLVDKVKHLVNP